MTLPNPPVESLVAATLGADLADAQSGSRSDWSFLSESSLTEARGRSRRQQSGLAALCFAAGGVLGALLWGSFGPQAVTETATGSVRAEAIDPELAVPRIGEVWLDLLPRFAVALLLSSLVIGVLWWAVSLLRARRVARPLGFLARTALLIVSALVAVVAAWTVAFDVYFIPSGSMQPTLDISDRILVDPSDTDVAIGDIVIHESDRFGPSSAANAAPLASVKRIVAVGGDIVEGTGGQLLVNGEPSTWISDWPGRPLADFSPVVLARHELFAMGDNHTASTDSRILGPVDVDTVTGTVRAIIWSAE